MNYDNLKISNQQAEDILFKLFNIKGSASALPGYDDFNFKVKVNNGENYILKISRPNEVEDNLYFQQELLQYVADKGKDIIAPKIKKDKNGNVISEITDEFGKQRKVRLLTWISGRVWSSVNPQLDSLRFDLGEKCGKLTSILHGFKNDNSHRNFEWDIAQSLWTKKHLHLFNEKEIEVLAYFQELFENNLESYSLLQKSIIHNDINDNNVLVSSELINPKVTAFIDYGDAMHTQIINELAIACSYAIMRENDPLDAALPIVKGYHSTFPIQEEELEHLYTGIAMRMVISVVSCAINKLVEPDREYLYISEKPSWELLKKWRNVSADFAYFSFRQTCGFIVHPNEEKFNDWATKNEFKITDLFPTAPSNSIKHIDLSVSSKWVGHLKDFSDLDYFQFRINQLQAQHPDKVIAGGYLEPRPMYTSSAYDKIGNNGSESRTIHLGIDFWFPAHTPVHALFDGEVVTAVNDAGDKEYGGLIILKHKIEDFEFFTLYGHNTVASVLKHKVGDTIKKGQKISELGNYPENGNWVPHLHFQIMLSMLDYKIDYPGVAYFNQLEVWKGLCLDPNLLFKSEAIQQKKKMSNNELIDYRKQHLGKNLSLQYKVPVKMVRGAGQYLMDQNGKKYLDTVNNVAHVGHENYNVVKAGQEQMALINTNSRYLHENINALTKELLETLPPELSVIHFVNSGSEANELAIRMVKAATDERDVIASEAGYHGNSNMCIDISSYKFDVKGGLGAPEYTHIFPLPDAFKGKYRGENTGEFYAEEIKICIEKIRNKGRRIGAFIIEPIISCGGQIELPKGFLEQAYKYVRDAGGLCISDEIQTGCGRMGKTFWGFQLHNVVPDIVTIGKPLGNGHPIAAVVCTQEVADKFANGMEYFNTFGGNPVSCAIATEVLRTIKREKLQENALQIGEFLKSELKKLSEEFSIIGDVRGQGLFLGIELVDNNMKPLAHQTDYLVNRMKDFGILMSKDGLDDNVLKIKPPLVFTKENAENLISYLKKIFKENFMNLKNNKTKHTKK
jgi:4-aminobutyrate aminotransferase-like enzyme/Ser/Thr protein kinase RdoA (MazF antagonist)